MQVVKTPQFTVKETMVPTNFEVVSVRHHRLFKCGTRTQLLMTVSRADVKIYGSPVTNGGATSVIIRDSQGILHAGIAACSLGDQYNKKLGVEMATDRAKMAMMIGVKVVVPSCNPDLADMALRQLPLDFLMASGDVYRLSGRA